MSLLGLWCGEALPANEFWDQTPRTFAAIMRGKAEARRGEHRRMIDQAYLIEAFQRTKDIGALRARLSGDPARRTSGTVILHRLQAMQAAGAPIRIKQRAA